MKFDKQFQAKMVPEMKQHYLDYKILVEQIRLVRKAAFTLGSAFADLNENTQQNMRYTIAVSSLEPEQRFWGLMEDNLSKVEEWYNETMEKHLSKFHELTYRSLQLGLMEKYIPVERSLTTQLDREIERLGLSSIVPWINDRLPATHPPASKCLVPMSRTSDLNDVISRSISGYKESRVLIRTLTDDFDSEDDMPLSTLLSLSDTTALKNKKAEEPMPDLPPPNWDEEDDDEEDAQAQFSSPMASSSVSGSLNTPANIASPSTIHIYHPPKTATDPQRPGPLLHRSTAPPISRNSSASAQRQQRQLDDQFFSSEPPFSIPVAQRSDMAPSRNTSTHGGYSSDDLAASLSDPNFFNQNDARSTMTGSTAVAANMGPLMGSTSASLRRARVPQTGINSMGPSGPRVPLNPAASALELDHAPPLSRANSRLHSNSSTALTSHHSHQYPHHQHTLSGPPGPTMSTKTKMDTFFEDFDDDREDDIVEPVRIEESDHQHQHQRGGIPGGANGIGGGQNYGDYATGPGGVPMTLPGAYPGPISNGAPMMGPNSVSTSDIHAPMLRQMHRSATTSPDFQHPLHPHHQRVPFYSSHGSPAISPQPSQYGLFSTDSSSVAGRTGSIMSSSTTGNRTSMLTGNGITFKPGATGGLASVSFPGSGLGPGAPNIDRVASPTGVAVGAVDAAGNLMDHSIAHLRREWSDFYKDLHLLKQFALLNVEAITKILNKHDKNISSGAKHRFLQLEGSKFAFLRREHLKLVIRETEHVFAQAFTGGHRTAAMSALRVSNEAPEVGMATFRFGFFVGVSMVMCILIAFVCVITDSAYLVKLRPGFLVFRLLSLITLLMWSWGLTMVVCTRYRINFTHIFEFPEKPLYQQVFEVAAFCTLVLTSAMLLFVMNGTQQFASGFEIPLLTKLASVPIAVLPLCGFALMIIVLIGLQIKSKGWGLFSLGRVLAAPFFPVTYQDFHTAEVLLSSAVLLFDLQFSICYFLVDSFRTSDKCQYSHMWVNPLIATLPSAWRTLQCLRRWADLQQSRHMWNAGKYSLGFAVTILAFMARIFKYQGNFWVALWAIAVIALTTINTYWDVMQDWTLGESQVKYPGLRKTLLLPARWYYASVAFTPVGRFFFALTLSPDIVSGWLNADVFTTLLAVVEIVRRTMWSILRLENEQISNADNYRAIGENVEEQTYPDFFGEDILDSEFV